MLINKYNPTYNSIFEKKTNINNKNNIAFGAQSQCEFKKALSYIANIEKVPEDASDDIKFIANTHNILINGRNANVFNQTIKGILCDPELKIKEEDQLSAYKTYLTYLNENPALINNPKKVFPKPEMFNNHVAVYITDYLENKAKEQIKQPEEIGYDEIPERSYRQKPKEVGYDDEVEISHKRSHHVKSGNWKNKLLSGGGWAATAILGTIMAAQNLNLPQIQIKIVPREQKDVAAQVDQNQGVSMPTKIEADSNKVIKSVNSGALTLFTLEKDKAQQGDRITLNGKSFPLYFDQQNNTWGTFLVFPKELPVENGKAKYPLSLERNGTIQRQLGLLEVNGRTPNAGESAAINQQSVPTNPSTISSNSLIMTQEAFIVPVQGTLGYKYGDVSPDGELIQHNEIKTASGTKVMAPARAQIVKISETGVILDGGWGLQFTISGIKANSDLKVGQIVERGSQIAESSGNQVNFTVNVNGTPTNFFGK